MEIKSFQVDKLFVEIKEVESLPNVILLTLEGKLNTLAVETLTPEFFQLLEEGIIHFIADCTHIAYLNSTALGSIINFKRQAEKRNGSFKLVGAQGRLLEIISIAQVKQFFDMYETLEEAINSYDFEDSEEA